LLVLVFQEALILACIGFLPGWGISAVLYYRTAQATGLPLLMTQSLSLFVYLLTLTMCFISGGIAVSKLKSADPADIF
jgi:putative ABC transport system permease protein